jgi:hypothetical protein
MIRMVSDILHLRRRICFVVAATLPAVALLAGAAACAPRGISGDPTPILLFNATGTSPRGVAAVEAILRSEHLAYSSANSSRLNEMPESDIRTHRLVIVAGGDFVQIGNGLSTSAAAHTAVAIATRDASTLDQYWEDGPQLPLTVPSRLR